MGNYVFTAPAAYPNGSVVRGADGVEYTVAAGLLSMPAVAVPTAVFGGLMSAGFNWQVGATGATGAAGPVGTTAGTGLTGVSGSTGAAGHAGGIAAPTGAVGNTGGTGRTGHAGPMA